MNRKKPKYCIEGYTLKRPTKDTFTPKLNSQIEQRLNEAMIQISDDPHSSQEIDIIIGLNAYLPLMTKRYEKISEHMEAVETVFGWSLFGYQHKADFNKPHRTSQSFMTTCLKTSMSLICSQADELVSNDKAEPDIQNVH